MGSRPGRLAFTVHRWNSWKWEVFDQGYFVLEGSQPDDTSVDGLRTTLEDSVRRYSEPNPARWMGARMRLTAGSTAVVGTWTGERMEFEN